MDKILSLRLTDLETLKRVQVPPQYVKPLAILGGLWAANQLYKLSCFIRYHFLRPYNLSKYKKGGKGEPWALVTGSSDGIGVGFAEELASQGFNVILHGRNEQKLQGVKKQMLSQWPERKFKILILDSAEDAGNTAKMAAALSGFKDLNIRILINNVGGPWGEKPNFRNFSGMDTDYIDGWIDLNLRFPTQITKVLLPTLVANQSALIINIGSGSSEISSPGLAVYSGTKAFIKAWSRSLAVELEDEGHDIDCHAIVVGMVATQKLGLGSSLTRPSPRTMARSSLGYAGSGVGVVAAHWAHDFQMSLFSLMPDWYGQDFIRKISKKVRDKELSDMAADAKQK
jgi:17beta-estradiol 17-dehydrogenase / very-long-chain 3-oxoacyl-CoA reductase